MSRMTNAIAIHTKLRIVFSATNCFFHLKGIFFFLFRWIHLEYQKYYLATFKHWCFVPEYFIVTSFTIKLMQRKKKTFKQYLKTGSHVVTKTNQVLRFWDTLWELQKQAILRLILHEIAAARESYRRGRNPQMNASPFVHILHITYVPFTPKLTERQMLRAFWTSHIGIPCAHVITLPLIATCRKRGEVMKCRHLIGPASRCFLLPSQLSGKPSILHRT